MKLTKWAASTQQELDRTLFIIQNTLASEIKTFQIKVYQAQEYHQLLTSKLQQLSLPL